MLNPDPHPAQDISPTAALLDELALTGYRPMSDEQDPRPLLEADVCRQALADAFDAIGWMLNDTRLEEETSDILWQFTNIFHRKVDRVGRVLDDNEQAQRRSMMEQNGSEVRSVELERLTAEGISLVEQRNAFEFVRDTAAQMFAQHTGSAWRPAAGSMVNRKTITSAMIDSRDFMNAKARADNAVLVPQGTLIAFTAGPDFNDHDKIFAALDRVREKHPDMILIHGATPKGGERIAACWANNRGVTQIPFKPDWNRHDKAAPFKRNDVMLDQLPAGVVAGPGNGVTMNMVDKARARGIPVMQLAA